MAFRNTQAGPGFSYNFTPAVQPQSDLERQFETYRAKVVELLTPLDEHITPHIPAIGRFLVVGTFFEDTLRIITQWSDQLVYLNEYRHIPSGITHLFLLFNIVTMFVASTMVVFKRRVEYASAALGTVVIVQALGYGLIFDLVFFLRNLSVIGGLLMLLVDNWRFTPASVGLLNNPNEKDNRRHYLLASRSLLVLLFISFMSSGTWSIWRGIFGVVGAIASLMVLLDFKSKASSIILIIIFSVFNILVNNFWTYHELHPHKDFAKYDFFQTLSIVGGLILFFHRGPGTEKKDN